MAAKREGTSYVGSWAFLIGVILAVILGAAGIVNTTMTLVLFVLGVIVGLLNIAEKEVNAFLMAGAVLVIIGALGSGVIPEGPATSWISGVYDALLIMFVPATIIVALKSVFSLARR